MKINISKHIISVLMSAVFLTLLAAPVIIVLIDESIDVAAFSSLSEEEKEIEKNNDFEIILFENKPIHSNLKIFGVENNLVYFLKRYSNPSLNLISPPPKFKHLIYSYII